MIQQHARPFVATMLAFAVLGATAETALPKVWMSTRWRDPFEDTVRACAEQGVEVVEVPTWSTNHCAYALAALRKHNVKGFTSSGPDVSGDVRDIVRSGRPFERAVCNGGVYLGRAIDRSLYSFSPRPHDIVIEPPVYSVRQPYLRNGARSGHYMGSLVPTGEAEVIVPEQPFDGKVHVRIIPCKVLPVEPGMVPDNDTVTPDMSGPEIESRRLVRIKFDLTGCADLMLDMVGIAVYWTSDTEGAAWKNGSGHLSVFSEHTRKAARESGSWRASQWAIVNGGTFPKDDIIAIRFGDECFNTTGWVDCRAGSFPLWGFSPSGRAAFAAAAPGLVQPRTWGFPEIYGAEAYGHSLYVFHKASAELVRAFVEGVRSVSPTLKVFRNTTRGGAWDESNDHDGSGQELLTRELDFVHLDPYPLTKKYDAERIPLDMGYMSGLARRYGKPLIPWMQAHAYAPGGLANVTPADMKRMWAEHLPFAPDGMMWLGFDMKPGTTDTEMTFPNGEPASWAYAKEMFADVRSATAAKKPVATLAILRPYTVRATCCARGAAWTSWRNPADKMLMAYAEAWGIDNGLFYDVFELPPTQTDAEKSALADELKKYQHVVSTIPWPGARLIGGETEGTVMKAREFAELRKRFAAEISVLKAEL